MRMLFSNGGQEFTPTYRKINGEDDKDKGDDNTYANGKDSNAK